MGKLTLRTTDGGMRELTADALHVEKGRFELRQDGKPVDLSGLADVQRHQPPLALNACVEAEWTYEGGAEPVALTALLYGDNPGLTPQSEAALRWAAVDAVRALFGPLEVTYGSPIDRAAMGREFGGRA